MLISASPRKISISLQNKPYLLRCLVVRLCDAISIASPRSLLRALHIRLFLQTTKYVLLVQLLYGIAFAASPLVTVQRIELKNVQGAWITVIEPDKHVDLSQESVGVTFINQGRVPVGEYINFRIVYADASAANPASVTALQDFQAPVWIKQTSFINVGFVLDGAYEKIMEASLIVDDKEVSLDASQIKKDTA